MKPFVDYYVNEAPNKLAQIVNFREFLVMLLTKNELIGSPTEADA